MPYTEPPSLRRFLIVEHVESLVTLFEGVLQEHFGCQIVTAGSFAAAIEHLETQSFDFALSDLVLPGGSGSGLSLVPWLRTHRPALSKRLIIVTASAGNRELAQAVNRGEVRVLYKPFNATGLVEAVEQALRAAEPLFPPGRPA